MEAAMVSPSFFKISSKRVANKNLHKTQRIKATPLKPKTLLSSSSSPQLKSHHDHYHRQGSPENHSTKHITHLVETFHENQRLKNLLKKLYNKDTCPLEILNDEGDWNKDQFWTVIRFLKETSRTNEILQVFDSWKNIEKSRINEVNYEKIIGLLVEVGLLEEAVLVFQQMKDFNLNLSLKVYNCMIHGFANKGEFGKASIFLKEMQEMNLKPEPKTYNGLIEAYANYGMYSEMSKCVRKMESNGCSDSFTYNLLTVGFARGGLLNNMERMHQTLLSRRMDLRRSTLVAMLEAYANVGLVEKMEYIYKKVLYSKAMLRDGLIRKMASVYVKNYMYSRLDELGAGIASRTGRTDDLVWCLRLLCHACLLSRKGMESIVREMERTKFSWNATVVNIMALAYLKMRDFKRLDVLLSQLVASNVIPDIVTIGVLFDGNTAGFDGIRIFQVWRRMGLLEKAVEMNTDPLVLTAFRKGSFLRSCEEMFSSLGPNAREERVWTYRNLIDMVFKHTGVKAQLGEVE